MLNMDIKVDPTLLHDVLPSQATSNELRPAETPFPGFPEPVQASSAEAVPIQSEVPAAAVPSPVHTCKQGLQGVRMPDSHAQVPGQAVHPQSAVAWFDHGLPMLLVEGQWVQPQLPAPPSQGQLMMPLSLWRQRRNKVLADHPEWADSQEGRLQAVTALQRALVADAWKAFGQPVDSPLEQPAVQTGVKSVQGRNGRWFRTVQLKPEPQPSCMFCREHWHCTSGCLPFANPTLLGDGDWPPVTGEEVSSTRPPADLHARASCACDLHSLLVSCRHKRFEVAAGEARCHVSCQTSLHFAVKSWSAARPLPTWAALQLPLLAVQVPSVTPSAEEPAGGAKDQQQLTSGRAPSAERVISDAEAPQQATSETAVSSRLPACSSVGDGCCA